MDTTDRHAMVAELEAFAATQTPYPGAPTYTTYLTVQGHVSTGTIIDTHKMTGELLIETRGHRAWITPDRIIEKG